MASITIRDLADEVRTQLRLRAPGHGHSIEEETRMILCHAVAGEVGPANLASAIRARFAPLDGVELEGDYQADLTPRGLHCRRKRLAVGQAPNDWIAALPPATIGRRHAQSESNEER